MQEPEKTLDSVKNFMNDIKNLNEGFITGILIFIILTIILSILVYYLYMRNLGDRECSLMNDRGGFCAIIPRSRLLVGWILSNCRKMPLCGKILASRVRS